MADRSRTARLIFPGRLVYRREGLARDAAISSRRRLLYTARSREAKMEIPLRRNTMKNTALRVLLTAAVLIPVAVHSQPRPGNPTTATVIAKAEIDKISATEQSQRTRDENAKVVDIGDNWSMELGIIHRASTRNLPPTPAPAAGAG